MQEQRCKGTNRAGEPCARRSSRNGFCSVHDPEKPQDMKAIGAKGGRGRTRSVLGISDEVADDSLRQKARERLHSMLDSDNPQLALRAAQSLFSYSSAKPPAELPDPSKAPGVNHRGVTITSLLNVAVFEAEGVVDDELADVILRAAGKVRELEAAGKLAPTFVDRPLGEAVEKFTSEVEQLAARRRDSGGVGIVRRSTSDQDADTPAESALAEDLAPRPPRVPVLPSAKGRAKLPVVPSAKGTTPEHRRHPYADDPDAPAAIRLGEVYQGEGSRLENVTSEPDSTRYRVDWTNG
jgi:hypothetical protein